MTAALYESIARIARHEANAKAISAVGKVVELFPGDGTPPDHAVSVKLRDSGLVLPRVAIAVGVMGFAAIPAIDDLVVILFLEGDVNAPIVVGRLYHPDQNPPKHQEGELVLKLPSGKAEPDLTLEISGKEPTLRLKLPGDVLLEVVQEKVVIQVGGADGMVISVDGAGGGRSELKAGDAKITLKKNGDITISTSTKLTLEGSEIAISGSSKVKITGAIVEVN